MIEFPISGVARFWQDRQVCDPPPPENTMADHNSESGPDHVNGRLYSIGEAADVLGFSIPSIRLYERLGLIVPIRRSSRHRRYSEADLARIRCIRSMLDHHRITIDVLVEALARIPCWELKGCAEEDRRSCGAQSNGTPCWAASGKDWQCRSEFCHECVVYRAASQGVLEGLRVQTT